MNCPNCNRHLEQDDFNFCPFCEKSIKGASASSPPAGKTTYNLAGEPAAPPPVVVQVRKEEKRWSKLGRKREHCLILMWWMPAL